MPSRRYKYGSKKRPKKFTGSRAARSGRNMTPTLASPSSPGPSQPVPLATASGKKIALQRESLQQEPEPAESAFATYQLIRTSSLLRFLETLTRCVSCGSPIELTETRSCRRGLVTKLTGVCTGCGKSEILTDPYREEDLEVNSRSVLAARAIGKGRAGLETLTNMMGIGAPVSSPAFTRHNQTLLSATEAERELNMAAAASYLRRNAAPDEVVNVKVTCDGTWQRRGHQSLFGVVVVASWETGQVLDVEVLSKWCCQCSAKEIADTSSQKFLDWWESHQTECEVNYSGSSGAMEREGALRIWRRSVEKHKLRYTSMIADGDSTSYSTIAHDEPYGKEYPVEKHECVGHVQKRMYARLKALKSRPHRTKDGEVVNLGGPGKGKLTDKTMKLLQRYYGKAIRSNTGNAEAMASAVMAIFHHCSSTDADPKHHLCPTGTTSWCEHNRALAKGEEPPSHTTTLSPEIAPFIKPTFEELSNPSLMERCVHGATQNQNESFNNLIWTRCPKTEFASSAVVNIAVNMAVLVFNSGQGALRGLFERLKYDVSPDLLRFLDKKDDIRIYQAEQRASERAKKRRQRMKQDRVSLQEEQFSEEGPTYGAGQF